MQEEDFLEIDDLISNIDIDFFCPMGPRSSGLGVLQNVRRTPRSSDRHRSSSVNNQTENSDLASVPSTSRGSRSTAGSYSYSTIRRRTTAYRPRRRKYKKRRTKTVIVEYEVGNNNKCPAVKKLKKKIKRKVSILYLL